MATLEKALICVVALLGVTLVACGDDDDGDDRASRAEPKLVEGVLKPGVEYTAVFRPRLLMRFPEPGWEVLRDTKVYTSFIRPAELETRTVSEVQPLAFVHPLRVYAPTRPDTLVSAPANLQAWLRRHPAVAAGRAEPVTVGGARGVRFEVRGPPGGRYLEDCARTPCKKLFDTAGIQVSAIRPGQAIELTLLDVRGETVIIAIDPAVADEARRVLDKLRFPQ
jgi:hypothetical protein